MYQSCVNFNYCLEVIKELREENAAIRIQLAENIGASNRPGRNQADWAQEAFTGLWTLLGPNLQVDVCEDRSALTSNICKK